MRLSYFCIFFTSMFFLYFSLDATTLIFKNQTNGPLRVRLYGWRRFNGFLYKQEAPREVNPGELLKWSPNIKSDIRQGVLIIYKGEKLFDIIGPKPFKGVLVPRGYERVIGYKFEGLFEDTIEQRGRALTKSFVIGANLLEKAREEFLKIFNKVFFLFRKMIRNVKNFLNPAPYQIIRDNPYVAKEARVRKGGSVACNEEKKIFFKRFKVVKESQEKFLGMKFALGENPLNIALIGSGGGQRSRIYITGYVCGLKKIGLLSTIMYFSTLSGSTWFLAPWLLSKMSLEDYKKQVIKTAKKNLGFLDFAFDIKYASDILLSKFAFGRSINVIDLYGTLLGAYYLKGMGIDGNPQRTYLSTLANDPRMKKGELVIPIFTAVTAEVGIEHVWCWMTPWEFGSRWFGFSGVYIPIWAFGREFENNVSKNWGSKKKPLYGPRTTLPEFMAIWGSAIAGTFGQAYDQIISGMKGSPIKAILHYMMKKTDLKKVRTIWAEIWNFMYRWPDSKFSRYKYLKLADAGVKMGCGIFPTYRCPSYGKNIKGDGPTDIFFISDASATVGAKELEMQVSYAKKHNLPFPEIDYESIGSDIINIFTKNPDPKKFKDYEIPTVIYMPRIIDKTVLKKYMNDPELNDLAERLSKFDIAKCMKKTCGTFNFKYAKEKDGYLLSEQLMALAEFNVRVCKDKIIRAMLERVELNRIRDGIKNAPPTPLQKEREENLKKIKVGTLEEVGNSFGMKECPICLEEFSEKDENISKLPCGHIFHKECVNEWLEKNTTCPVCRKPVK